MNYVNFMHYMNEGGGYKAVFTDTLHDDTLMCYVNVINVINVIQQENNQEKHICTTEESVKDVKD